MIELTNLSHVRLHQETIGLGKHVHPIDTVYLQDHFEFDSSAKHAIRWNHVLCWGCHWQYYSHYYLGLWSLTGALACAGSLIRQKHVLSWFWYLSLMSNSLYTTFLIHIFPCWSKHPQVLIISIPCENATYSWPCEKTSSSRITPTRLRVKPWALLIVMANARRMGSSILCNRQEPMLWSNLTLLTKIPWPARIPCRTLALIEQVVVHPVNHVIPVHLSFQRTHHSRLRASHPSPNPHTSSFMIELTNIFQKSAPRRIWVSKVCSFWHYCCNMHVYPDDHIIDDEVISPPW